MLETFTEHQQSLVFVYMSHTGVWYLDVGNMGRHRFM